MLQYSLQADNHQCFMLLSSLKADNHQCFMLLYSLKADNHHCIMSLYSLKADNHQCFVLMHLPEAHNHHCIMSLYSLEVIFRLRKLGSRFIGNRPHDDRGSVLVSLNHFCHDILVVRQRYRTKVVWPAFHNMHDVTAIRQTLEPFQRQRWGNLAETGWSTYGLFQAHRYHLELNWIDYYVVQSVEQYKQDTCTAK